MKSALDWTLIDPQLRQVYADRRYRALAGLAKATGIDGRRLSDRAITLGLRAMRLPPAPLVRYSAGENAMLIDHYPKPIRKLQQLLKACGYPHRTPSQLSNHLYELRKQGKLPDKHAALEDRDVYSINQLVELLGIPHRTVSGWVAQGLLPSTERRPEGDRRVSLHQIRRRDVQAFLRDYPGHWNSHKCDHFWLVDILTAPSLAAPMRVHRQDSCGSGSADLIDRQVYV